MSKNRESYRNSSVEYSALKQTSLDIRSHELNSKESAFSYYLEDKASIKEADLDTMKHLRDYAETVKRSPSLGTEEKKAAITELNQDYKDIWGDNGLLDKFENRTSKAAELNNKLFIYMINALHLLETPEGWEVKMCRTNTIDDIKRGTDLNLVFLHKESGKELVFSIDTTTLKNTEGGIETKLRKIQNDFYKYGRLRTNKYFRSPFNKKFFRNKEMPAIILGYDRNTLTNLVKIWDRESLAKQKEYPYASDEERDRLIFSELGMGQAIKDEMARQIDSQIRYVKQSQYVFQGKRESIGKKLETVKQVLDTFVSTSNPEIKEGAITRIAPTALPELA